MEHKSIQLGIKTGSIIGSKLGARQLQLEKSKDHSKLQQAIFMHIMKAQKKNSSPKCPL